MKFKQLSAIACVALQLGSLRLFAQDQATALLGPQPPAAPFLLRPYLAPTVPPIRLSNSARLRSLIRAGSLYLTVQDAIALAIENNLNLEVERYGPLIAHWQFVRQSGGGPLRGAGGNGAQVGQVASGQGVLGSEASGGLQISGGGGGSGTGGGNAVVQQVGYVAPNFDPTLTNASTFSHVSTPQPNQVASQTESLVDNTRSYQTTLQQGLVTGGLVRIQQTENYLDENAPTDSINPSAAPRLILSAQQPFLQGLGKEVNTYYIRVARNNIEAADAYFRSQLLNLVASVLNMYWDLVSANESVASAQRALDIAQKFDDETRQRIRLGTLAGYQVTRADAQLATQRQVLQLAQMQALQAELPLKGAISRDEDPLLDAARIVTMDRIEVPPTDDIAPLRQLVATAMTKRPDVAVANINAQNAGIASVGTANPLLPTGIAYASTWNQGAASGLGTAFGQVARRNFPTEYAGVYLTAPLNNRLAQGDYGIDQLQLRQNQLSNQRDRNQIVTEIANQVLSLKQARAAYAAAVSARELQEQLLQAEQDKFSFGSSSIDSIVLAQRALVAAQSTEVATRSTYAHARVALDQATGETLEINRVSLEPGETAQRP